jgi:hypothetical protein
MSTEQRLAIEQEIELAKIITDFVVKNSRYFSKKILEITSNLTQEIQSLEESVAA